MASNKTRKIKRMLGSYNKSNRRPPMWVIQRTQNLRMYRRRNTRNWRRTKKTNRIRKKLKE